MPRSHIENLQADGLAFESCPRRGLRLAGEPEELYPDLLRAWLMRVQCPARVLVFPEVDSTNSEAERQLASGRQIPFVVLASKQAKGRGRRGRGWYSPAEGNVYMSFVFHRRLALERVHSFTLWMGLNLCRALNRRLSINAKIKWPNDLVLDRKKLGGMLAEAQVKGDHSGDLIFGFGLNVNSRFQPLDDDTV